MHRSTILQSCVLQIKVQAPVAIIYRQLHDDNIHGLRCELGGANFPAYGKKPHAQMNNLA
jgi:hypothetical protein